MRPKTLLVMAAMLAVLVGMNLPAQAAEKGRVQLQSAGPLTFGPQGTLLVGDPKAATIYAIETDDSGSADGAEVNIGDLSAHITKTLKGQKARIADMAVNPQSGRVYFSVTTSGPESRAVLLRTTEEGNSVTEFSTEDVRYTKATLVDAPQDKLVEGRRGRKTNLRL